MSHAAQMLTFAGELALALLLAAAVLGVFVLLTDVKRLGGRLRLALGTGLYLVALLTRAVTVTFAWFAEGADRLTAGLLALAKLTEGE